MKVTPYYTLNINGKLLSLEYPVVMGILNVTPDSFFSGSRCQTREAIEARADEIISQGGQIIDMGAYSSRPQAENISPEEEMKRLAFALEIVRTKYPDIIISIDTFRSEVAQRCVSEYGANIINDISAGELDKKMIPVVGKLGIPYIAMHMQGTPQNMQQHTHYNNIVADVLYYFSQKIAECKTAGILDIIIDPGFGFSKTQDDNYKLMRHLSDFGILEMPLLVGISRKSMIYKLTDSTPEDSLNGTTVLNTFSLLNGANIIRVHDVKEAVETVKITCKTLKSE